MAITNKAKNKRKVAHQALMAEWLEALRSGEYKQGTGALHQVVEETGTHTFCCLGVLGDVCVKNGLIAKPVADGDQYKYCGDAGSLDGKLFKLSGLYDTLGEFTECIQGGDSLAELNDGDGTKRKTFKQIAKVIESQLKHNKNGLFNTDLVALK